MSIDVLGKLEDAGAVLLDKHFVYKSGKHGSGYINLDVIFPNVALMAEICTALVEPFKGEIDTVAAPAVGGITLSVLSALAATSPEHPVAGIWADKDGGRFAFERAGFTEELRGKRVLVVEDLLTTGGSAMSVCEIAKQHGAKVIGVSVICNRGGLTADQMKVPRLCALATVNFTAVDADECEQCAAGVPIVGDIGHGSKFMMENPEYPGGYSHLLRV